MGWIWEGQDRRRKRGGAEKALDGNPLRHEAGLLIVGALMENARLNRIRWPLRMADPTFSPATRRPA